MVDTEKAAQEAAATLLIEARRQKVKRDAWEEKLTELLVQGTLRRGHLLPLISAARAIFRLSDDKEAAQPAAQEGQRFRLLRDVLAGEVQ